MRRLLARWDDLPRSKDFSMTVQGEKQAYAELDAIEDRIRREHAMAEGA